MSRVIDITGAERFRVMEARGQRALYGKSREPTPGTPAIDGLATLYGVVHTNGRTGGREVMQAGCFAESLASRSPKQVLVDHDATCRIGATGKGLEFFDAADGLAFRWELPRTSQARAAHGMVLGGDRSQVSVGYRVLASDIRDEDGVLVRYITKAELTEISLCRVGAVPGTMARVVDASIEPAPTPDGRSFEFKTAAKMQFSASLIEHLSLRLTRLDNAIQANRGSYAPDPAHVAGAAQFALIRQCRGWA